MKPLVIDQNAWVDLGERLHTANPEKFAEYFDDLQDIAAIEERQAAVEQRMVATITRLRMKFKG